MNLENEIGLSEFSIDEICIDVNQVVVVKCFNCDELISTEDYAVHDQICPGLFVEQSTENQMSPHSGNDNENKGKEKLKTFW